MCTFAHVIEVLTKKTKVTKRVEIQIRILALNFYMWKRFTGQQDICIKKTPKGRVPLGVFLLFEVYLCLLR
ncbi:hypothetical protein CLI71_04945 [Prevotella intermedia]|uniref:Uncharacterized protein n=1 Tax=Prevotella intermedia TaxID=28131 RepID=A0A2A6EG73_PREIN|nr:hypothetical protein CLI71_04945 [Prevotella intermedia]